MPRLTAMGWSHESYPGHEGYAVCLVAVEGRENVYRELQYPKDDKDRKDILYVQAACACGWRSPRFIPHRSAEWVPFCACLAHADDDRVHTLWMQHLGNMPAGEKVIG